jgi:hypothetical protein
MANTTNYNWETPDDTDLVKDGAAAIRTLGSSVDITTKALNPSTTLGDIEYRSATANTNTRLGIGSTGQVLTVAGGVPTWATSDDANAIQNSLLTTTGDTIYASGASTPARLGIGSTGQVLTVAGGVPSWATPSAGATFVGCKAYKSANQTLSNATTTLITFNSEFFDTDAIHDTSTNTSRFTVPAGKGGKWQLSTTIAYDANSTGFRQIRIKKNGTIFNNLIATAVSSDGTHMSHTDIFELVATDYMELEAYQNSGGNLAILGTNYTTFSFFYLGA